MNSQLNALSALESAPRRRGRPAKDTGETTPSLDILNQLTDPRPRVRVDLADDKVVDSLIDALVEANDPTPIFFQRGRKLVRVIEVLCDGVVSPQIEELTVDSLRIAVQRIALCVRMSKTKGEPVPSHPTRDHLAGLLNEPSWPVPELSGIVEVPVMRPDGTIHDTPGYDPATMLVYHPAPGLVVPQVPLTPSAGQVNAAKQLLLDELMGEFPFTDQTERANALALGLLPYVRPIIKGPTPLHLVESATPGEGKSLLVEMLLRPAVGMRLAADPDKTDESETRKWITSKAVASAPVCWIDNVRHGLDNSVLANALTSARWSDRMLGENAVFEREYKPIWAATANNPVLSEEMTRRTVRIRLVSGLERPAMRTDFRHPDLRAWNTAHRGDLIAAALTLIRAWVVAGRPNGKQRMGSFESYVAVIGGILDVIGVPGFLDNQMELYDVADSEAAQWGALVDLWRERCEETGFVACKASDLYELALEVENFDMTGKTTEGERGAVTMRSFGKLVHKQRDKIYGDAENGWFKITMAGTKQRFTMWKLEPVTSPKLTIVS